jgi:hypothetical protein
VFVVVEDAFDARAHLGVTRLPGHAGRVLNPRFHAGATTWACLRQRLRG